MLREKALENIRLEPETGAIRQRARRPGVSTRCSSTCCPRHQFTPGRWSGCGRGTPEEASKYDLAQDTGTGIA